jgi:preprotein translocase subunit YajC
MDYLILNIFSMMQPPEGGEGGGMLMWFFPFIMIFVLYYFLLHLPQKKKQQEHKKMLDAIKRGDEVITTGGIYGKVAGVTDKVITVEIAPKVKVRVARSQVSGVTSKSGDEGKGKDKGQD